MCDVADATVEINGVSSTDVLVTYPLEQIPLLLPTDSKRFVEGGFGSDGVANGGEDGVGGEEKLSAEGEGSEENVEVTFLRFNLMSIHSLPQ